jgi:hypothetical protein
MVMNAETIREVLIAQPFSPFKLMMSSGQAYEVSYHDMALLTRSEVLVGIDIENDGLLATFKICSLLHVTALGPLSPARTEGKQGES